MRCKQPGHGARACPFKFSTTNITPLNALLGDSDSDDDSEETFSTFSNANRNPTTLCEDSDSDHVYSEENVLGDSHNPNAPLSKLNEPNILHKQPQVMTLSQRHQKQFYRSKSAENGANQQWNRFCRFWNDLVKTGKVTKTNTELFEPAVFDNISPEMLAQPMEQLIFQVSHLQRAHLLSIYFEQLTPTTRELTHYDGGTLKGYVDDVVRKLKAQECKSQRLSSYYGNWSWKSNCEYEILNDTLESKILEEDDRFRGQKLQNACTSDSISMKSWKLLVSETTAKRDRYKSSNDLENYIKTNASLCVLIHTLFCGCRAQQEIANFILKDFTDHSKFCIEFKLSGDFKTRKLINFKFTDRMSSFIFGEQNCEPFRIFLYNRPPNAIGRFFLYHMPSARFGDKILLAAAKQIGPKVLAKAVQNEVRSLVAGGYVMDGLYTNTSLRKGLTDRLALAGVPTVLVDLAVGHFNSKSGRTSSVFQDTPNLNTYLSLWKQTNTRKKIGLLLFDLKLSWKDIADDDDFFKCYQKAFPHEGSPKIQHDHLPHILKNHNAANDNILDLDAFNFDDSLLSQPINVVDTSNVPSPLPASAVTAGSDIFDLQSYPDELFLSFLLPQN